MGDDFASAFASAFGGLSAWPEEEAGSPPEASPPLVIGFERTASSADQEVALHGRSVLATRQGSLGAALAAQHSPASEEASGPKLSIQTTRSLRLTRVKAVTRVQEVAAELPAATAAAAAAGGWGTGDGGAREDVLAGTLPAHRRLALSRAASGNIDIAPR